MNSFTEIVETWGRRQMGIDIGVTKDRARDWSRCNSIPAKYWKRVLELAPSRNIELTPVLLVELAHKHDA